MGTPTLSEVKLEQALKRVERQRDELLAALKRVVEYEGSLDSEPAEWMAQSLKAIRSAEDR
jgi:hypothetical protein